MVGERKPRFRPFAAAISLSIRRTLSVSDRTRLASLSSGSSLDSATPAADQRRALISTRIHTPLAQHRNGREGAARTGSEPKEPQRAGWDVVRQEAIRERAAIRTVVVARRTAEAGSGSQKRRRYDESGQRTELNSRSRHPERRVLQRILRDVLARGECEDSRCASWRRAGCCERLRAIAQQA